MNPKINKLKAEREKNSKKIAALQQRNREIDDSIHELENLDIVGMVRSCGMTPEQLAVLIRASKGVTLPPLPAQLTETEESEYEEAYHDLKDPSVSGFFRFMAKLGDRRMAMQIVQLTFGEA